MAARKVDTSCSLNMGDTYQRGYISTFPVSRGGWAQTHEAAVKHAKDTGHLAMVDLKCAGGAMPLYQCDRDHKDRSIVHCVIERFSDYPGHPTPAIAGARRARRRRR